MVQRPPTSILPKRENGTDKIVMLGVMSRTTMRSAGLAGTNLSDIMRCWSCEFGELDGICAEVVCGLTDEVLKWWRRRVASRLVKLLLMLS